MMRDAVAALAVLCAAGAANAQTPIAVEQFVGRTPVSNTNPLPVVVSGSLSGGADVRVCVTPTVTAANAYGINFVVGGLLSFANAFTATGSGILQGVTVQIKQVETAGFTFYPFNAQPTGGGLTDATAAALTAADVFKASNPIFLSANTQLAASGFSVQYAYGLGAPLATGTTTLSGVLIVNAALTTNFATASDLQVCINVLQDP